MECAPYVRKSVIIRQLWEDVAARLGLHGAVVRAEYNDRWFVSIGLKDFVQLIKDGEITRADFPQGVPTDEQKASYENWLARSSGDDFVDLINYRLKKLIQVGDQVVADESKTFTSSRKRYITRGKRYKIVELKDEGGSEFGFQTRTDIRGESNWGSVHGCRSVWRRGKEVWNWNLAYLELFKEQEPGHPQMAEVERDCKRAAKQDRLGRKS